MSLSKIHRLQDKIKEYEKQIQAEYKKPVNPRVVAHQAMVRSDIWTLKLSHAMRERLWNAGIKSIHELKAKYDSNELLNLAAMSSRQLKVIGKMLYRCN